MEDQIQHTVSDKKITIEILTNRFTHDLVNVLKNTYPVKMLAAYNVVEFNLRQVRMIDSSSIGFLFDLHNKLKAHESGAQLEIAVGDNKDLHELFHKFQVDLLLKVH